MRNILSLCPEISVLQILPISRLFVVYLLSDRILLTSDDQGRTCLSSGALSSLVELRRVKSLCGGTEHREESNCCLANVISLEWVTWLAILVNARAGRKTTCWTVRCCVAMSAHWLLLKGALPYDPHYSYTLWFSHSVWLFLLWEYAQ